MRVGHSQRWRDDLGRYVGEAGVAERLSATPSAPRFNRAGPTWRGKWQLCADADYPTEHRCGHRSRCGNSERVLRASIDKVKQS